MSKINEIIELAWKDSVSFSDIYEQYGLTESDVKRIMRNSLKGKSYKIWRMRVKGRYSAHNNR